MKPVSKEYHYETRWKVLVYLYLDVFQICIFEPLANSTRNSPASLRDLEVGERSRKVHPSCVRSTFVSAKPADSGSSFRCRMMQLGCENEVDFRHN